MTESAIGSCGPHWYPENHHPKSETAAWLQTEEGQQVLEGSEKVCPHADIIDKCAVLVGIDPASYYQDEKFCGAWVGGEDYSLFGSGDKRVAKCREIATELAKSISLAQVTKPSEKILEKAHTMAPAERNGVFAKLDGHNEGVERLKQLKEGLASIGEPSRKKSDVLSRCTELLEELLAFAAGVKYDEFACEQAPEKTSGVMIRSAGGE